ncbi:7937_t:CDS:1, partial [Dentiscutata heterogama]
MNRKPILSVMLNVKFHIFDITKSICLTNLKKLKCHIGTQPRPYTNA